jgi:hypothetical protein
MKGAASRKQCSDYCSASSEHSRASVSNQARSASRRAEERFFARNNVKHQSSAASRPFATRAAHEKHHSPLGELPMSDLKFEFKHQF